MGIETKFSISDPVRVIDFYGSPYNNGAAAIAISLDSTTSASATRLASTVINIVDVNIFVSFGIRQARAQIDVQSDNTTAGTKIALAACSIDVSASTSVSSLKIATAASAPSSDTSLVGITSKFAYAQTIISPSADSVIIGKEILKATALSAADVSTQVIGSRIKQASILISNLMTVTLTVGKVAYANAGLSSQVGLMCTLVKFAGNNVIDTAGYRTLLVLDNKPLTDQGRVLNDDLNQSFIENKNWNNQKSRYYKKSSSSGRMSFSLSWSFLPDSRYDTVDKRYARDYIKEIASDPDVHTLKIINQDVVGANAYSETEYLVYVRDYSENLIRRDIGNGMYFWDCTLTLEEV
jgi:hypothetical protein